MDNREASSKRGKRQCLIQGDGEINGSATAVGRTTSDGSGVWVYDYTATVLDDGAYKFAAVAIDSLGGTTAMSPDAGVVIDTAGIRRKGKTTEGAEKLSILKAKQAMARADVSLLLIDAVEGATHQDAVIAGYAQEAGAAVILVVVLFPHLIWLDAVGGGHEWLEWPRSYHAVWVPAFSKDVTLIGRKLQIKRGTKVYEFGSGDGRFLRLVARRGAIAGPFKMHGSLPVCDGGKMNFLICHPGTDLQQAIRSIELDPPGSRIQS